MITVNQRNQLILAIYQQLDIPVIPADDDGNIPSRPYVVYSIIRDNGSNGQDSITHRVQKDTSFISPSQPTVKEVLYKQYTNQKEGTFSFTVHSESRDIAQSLCADLKNFFERSGRAKVEAAGFAVIDVETAQDRSILFGDHYERRRGFDVRIRYIDRSEYVEESIDELTL